MEKIVRKSSDIDVVHPEVLTTGQSASRPGPAPPAPGWAAVRLRPAFAVFCFIACSAGIVAVLDTGTLTHVHSGGAITGALAVTSLIATLVYLAVLTSLHVLPTGYSPVRHAVSDYAVGRFGSLFDAALYISSIGVLTLAFALLRSVGSPPLAARALVFLLVIPLTRVGMALFPTSLEGRRITRTGLIHYGFAIAAFTLTYLAISSTTPALQALDVGRWTHAPLGWAAWAVGPALLLVVITMTRPLRRVFGLFERIFLVTTNVWFALAAILLITRLT